MDFSEIHEKLKWYQKLPWINQVRFPVSRILFVGKPGCLRLGVAEYYFRKYRYYWNMLHACSVSMNVPGGDAAVQIDFSDLKSYSLVREHFSRQTVDFLKTYSSLAFSEDLLEAMDVILTLDDSLAFYLRRKYKGISYKIFSLKEFVYCVWDRPSFDRLNGSKRPFGSLTKKVDALKQTKQYVRHLVTILDFLEDVVAGDGVIFDGTRSHGVRGG